MPNEVVTTTPAEIPAYVEPKEVEHLTSLERDEWLKTGDRPPKESPKPDASAASKPAIEKDGKAAESGTAKEKRPVDKRIEQLLEERKAEKERVAKLEADIEELRKGAKPATETKQPEAAKAPEAPKRPRMGDFLLTNGTLDSEKYEAAMDKYEKERDEFKEFSERQKNAGFEQQRLIDKWKTDLRAKYSEKADGIDVKKTVDSLVSTVKDAPAFAAFLNDSEVFTDLLFLLGTDPDLPALIEMAKTNPTKAIRRLIFLESEVKKETSVAKDEKKEEPAAEPPKEKSEKKITSAGKPPSEVGGKSSSAEDDAEAALKQGDGEAYRRIMNQREVDKRRAARKGR